MNKSLIILPDCFSNTRHNLQASLHQSLVILLVVFITVT
jgi:hypothetical protein